MCINVSKHSFLSVAFRDLICLIFYIQVNNVGTNIRKPTTEYTSEEYSKIMLTNFESAYHMCQLAHPLLKASGKGSIVFISSVAGLQYFGSSSIYGASKGELLMRISVSFLMLRSMHRV